MSKLKERGHKEIVGVPADIESKDVKRPAVADKFAETGVPEYEDINAFIVSEWRPALDKTRETSGVPKGLDEWAIGANVRYYNGVPDKQKFYNELGAMNETRVVVDIPDADGKRGKKDIKKRKIGLTDAMLGYAKMEQQGWQEEPHQNEVREKKNVEERLGFFVKKIDENGKWAEKLRFYLEKARATKKEIQHINTLCYICEEMKQPIDVSDRMERAHREKLVGDIRRQIKLLEIDADGMSEESVAIYEVIVKKYLELLEMKKTFDRRMEEKSSRDTESITYIMRFVDNMEKIIKSRTSDYKDILDQKKISEITEIIKGIFDIIEKGKNEQKKLSDAGQSGEWEFADKIEDPCIKQISKLVELLGDEFLNREYKRFEKLFGTNFLGYEKVTELWGKGKGITGTDLSGGENERIKNLIDSENHRRSKVRLLAFSASPENRELLEEIEKNPGMSKDYVVTCDIPGVSLESTPVIKEGRFPGNGYKTTLSKFMHPNDYKRPATERIQWRFGSIGKNGKSDLAPIQVVQDMLLCQDTYGLYDMGPLKALAPASNPTQLGLQIAKVYLDGDYYANDQSYFIVNGKTCDERGKEIKLFDGTEERRGKGNYKYHSYDGYNNINNFSYYSDKKSYKN